MACRMTPSHLRVTPASSVVAAIVNGAAELRASTEVLHALRLLAIAPALPRTDEELARSIGTLPNRLRYLFRKDLGLTVACVRRWARLIRASYLRDQGVRRVEIGVIIGVDERTLARDARALVELTFEHAAKVSPEALAQELVGRYKSSCRR